MRRSQADKDVDATVGTNIRRFREISGISQKKLGDAIGVTFQQIQKYESDRISASKLVETARTLGCDRNSLFAGIEIGDVTLAFPDHSTAALKIAANFDRIASPEQRAAIALLVAALATQEE
ncbi:helix-turn-helix domain-containing protein [Sinorhizobium medicae]|uniref:helix-turn-helix domain-containing protein n=1 Tax=Sinorhizobium medicae TaxID=110321 RepID=UPI001F3BBE3F|nr:helix-turn-helix transcriptional regulator [Sinorhizobium medicae]